MPLNTLRLNHQAHTHPNPRITFIKPLPLPHAPTPADVAAHARADRTLRAIAAQCLPVMLTHHLSVTTLEEHEPNREFIGRNFNNGEIVQLVLRARQSDGGAGGWLPLRMVQMVMMHELAHCAHMNHSRKFWEVRNLYAAEMRELFQVGYTGEGFWGGGQRLGGEGDLGLSGGFVGSEEVQGLPVCGGTFRSRRRKRKVKSSEELTWREKRDRRIEKKFGKNGLALGEDEDRRLALEINGRSALGSKPRVAQSKRGRELRAAAALARLEQSKVLKEEDETASESEYEDVDAGEEDARDVDSERLIDAKGHGMIRVCVGEEPDDVLVKQEMDELADVGFEWPEQDDTVSECSTTPAVIDKDVHPNLRNSESHNSNSTENQQSGVTEPTQNSSQEARQQPKPTAPPQSEVACPICSLSNVRSSATCQACAHVLHPDKDSRSWRCTSDACRGSEYVNAGDCGICGICGTRKATTDQNTVSSRPKLDLRTTSGHIAYL